MDQVDGHNRVSDQIQTTENDSTEVNIDDMTNPLLDNDTNTALQADSALDNEPTSSKSKVYSLAYHPLTPTGWCWMVPLFILCTHGLFLYGQVSDMWYLYFDVDTNIVIAPNTTEAKLLFEILGASNINLTTSYQKTISKFDYWEAVQALWRATGIANKSVTRVGAVALVLFSGIWPHLKLALLHLFWFVPTAEATRTTVLYWLSTFGKWSLADIFVVCLLIAVLNLDLPFTGAALIANVKSSFPEIIEGLEKATDKDAAVQTICQTLLHLQCHGTISDLECNACKYVVEILYDHPSIIESVGVEFLDDLIVHGSGNAQLRVAGVHGIYVFCVAVLLSLFLSSAIDTADHKAKSHKQNQLLTKLSLFREVHGEQPYMQLMDSEEGHEHVLRVVNRSLSGAGEQFEEALGMNDGDNWLGNDTVRASTPGRKSRIPHDKKRMLYHHVRHVYSKKKYFLLVLVSLCNIFLIVFALTKFSMKRTVPGSVPDIVNVTFGATFTREYSLQTLTSIIGWHGGWDYFLETVFAIFCVFGPLLRGIGLVAQLLIPGTHTSHRRIMFLVNSLGAFCAWDVFLLAIVLINTEMPSITETLLKKDSALCTVLHSYGYPQNCIEIDFAPEIHFAYVLVAGSLLMLCATFSTKLVFRGIDPYGDGDLGGPYCGDSCANFIWDSNTQQDSHYITSDA